ncbi:MAG TPA: SUMF1/EgtB/PvdO family nonheme iron enzyme [Lacunisphaera sp.]|jgi:formylglycine-generating enzyme required for sulfatase activity
MRNPPLFLFALFMVVMASASAQTKPDQLALVQGGVFTNAKSNYYGKNALPSMPYIGKTVSVPDFYLGRYEVTQKEWTEVMGNNPSKFKGDRFPVENVSWYDCVEYCNKRSLAGGLKPYYTIDRNKKDSNNENEIDDIKWTVTINEGANGYRLPTEAEWEYAASGGQQSKNYTYSGSDDIDEVAWYWANAGDKPLSGAWTWPAIEHNHNRTRSVGGKDPNELGLYDMSGNVREWCWNWYAESASNETEPRESAAGRVWRGGGWMGGDFCCASSFRGGFEASGKGPDQGVRVCRNR